MTTGRDKSGGGGRSEEDRLRDLAARERARVEGKRPPPSFGPSTRAGRERAAASGRPVPTPQPSAVPAGQDSSFDFDFARPSTRAATPAGYEPTAAPAPAPTPTSAPAPTRTVVALTDDGYGRDTATATVDTPPATDAAEAPEREPRTTPQGPPVGEGPQFAPLRGPGRTRTRDRDRDRGRTRSPRAGGSWVRRNRIGLAAVAGGAVLLLAVVAIAGSGSEDAADSEQAAETKRAPSPYGTPTPTPLPPETRVVAYTGAPQAKELGILGTMPFERAADRLERQAAPYDRASRPVMPAFDLIATIANAHPGPADKYRTRQSGKVIARYLRAARRHNAALILDVQPGTSNFVDEVKPLERWLKEPDVHLALDPEWRMRPGVQPGSEIGWVSAGEVTATLNRVARIVRANKLPPKLVIVHRFTDGMIKDLPTVDVPKEVVGVISIDGVGTRTQKIQTYDRIAPTLPKPWLPGFKLFYVEDKAAGGMLSGKQVMAMRPRPHVVLYE